MCINIVLITKQEKEYLVKHGVPYAEGGVSHSESCHKRKKFYLCETPHNMRLLENYIIANAKFNEKGGLEPSKLNFMILTLFYYYRIKF